MKNLIYTLCVFCGILVCELQAQTKVSGLVEDQKGNPIPFANVYLREIYDGATTDENGFFEFTTEAQGKATLAVSFTGYKVLEVQVDLTESTFKLNLVMEEASQALSPVVITAGAFEASDQKKATILKPLDIVTVAGASADVYGALRTLPGVSQVGNENGLFVRGGQASETQTVINGLLVQTPFFSNVPDIPSRGRFDPFMFKGTLFSTGGYSAEYGQALSSVLILNTQDIPDQTATGISLNLAGVDVNHVQTFGERKALIGGGGYTNLNPWFNVMPQNVRWQSAPNGLGGSLAWLQQSESGSIWKTYVQYQTGKGGSYSPDLEQVDEAFLFRYQNYNLFTNSSYEGFIGDNWDVYAGVSYAHDIDNLFPGDVDIRERESLLQGKFKLGRDFSNSVYLFFGAEGQLFDGKYDFNEFTQTVDEAYTAVFTEADVKFSQKFAARLGVRGEYSGVLQAASVAPRLSLAYKTGADSQVSFAYGWFYQRPENEFLRQANNLDFEQATHYILNYQWLGENHTFRAEVYYKSYDNLIKGDVFNGGPFQNTGDGYASGIDIFWRDQKTIKNLDYWVSYSYIKSERNFRDYPNTATPTFLTPHTLSLVARYFIPKQRLRFGATYTLATGRTYVNPNNEEFLGDTTPNYHNLSFNVSYLTSILGSFSVLYASVGNPFGWQQVFGYRYSEDGMRRNTVLPTMTTSVFMGVFISIE